MQEVAVQMIYAITEPEGKNSNSFLEQNIFMKKISKLFTEFIVQERHSINDWTGEYKLTETNTVLM